jgi:hypothetical protein
MKKSKTFSIQSLLRNFVIFVILYNKSRSFANHFFDQLNTNFTKFSAIMCMEITKNW